MNINMYVINAILVLMVVRQIREHRRGGSNSKYSAIWYRGGTLWPHLP